MPAEGDPLDSPEQAMQETKKGRQQKNPKV